MKDYVEGKVCSFLRQTTRGEHIFKTQLAIRASIKKESKTLQRNKRLSWTKLRDHKLRKNFPSLNVKSSSSPGYTFAAGFQKILMVCVCNGNIAVITKFNSSRFLSSHCRHATPKTVFLIIRTIHAKIYTFHLNRSHKPAPPRISNDFVFSAIFKKHLSKQMRETSCT